MAERVAVLQARIEEARQAPSSASDGRLVALFDELRDPLLRYLCQFPLSFQDAEDVLQEVFLSLHQQLRRGRSIEEVRGWIFRAAQRAALKKRLRSRKDVETGQGFNAADNLAVDPAPDPEELLASAQKQDQVQAAVRSLPAQDRWCLYLRAEGLRYRQIAEVLDISLGSVCNILERSLARIARATKG